MKKKIILLAAVIICACLMSGCALIIDSLRNQSKESGENTSSFFTIFSTPKQSEDQPFESSPAPTFREYTITYETNGGTHVYPRTCKTVTTAPETTKDGYLFDGWYRDSTCKVPVIFPLDIDKNMTVYAKWFKISETIALEGDSIKMWGNYNSSAQWLITPNGFDMERLETEGYYMTITVNYDVKYKKDYDALWDIGYMGSPKFEAELSSSRGIKDSRRDMNTTTNLKSRSLSITSSIADLKNSSVTLIFSTDNVQNIIYFQNITVTYSCFK